MPAWQCGRVERWWLRAVVRHCALDARRAAARVQYDVELDAREGSYAAAMSEARVDARREARALVKRAERLTPPLRAVFDTRLRRMRMRLRGA